MLRKLLGGKGRPKERAADAKAAAPIPYEKARSILEHEELEGHRALAQRTDSPPEMLYYLAENGADDVRVLVAGNPATPHKANLLLTEDELDEVRCELARKIARLLPDLGNDDQTKLRDGAVEVIERLARDNLPRVRQILAEELKHSSHVPAHVVRHLAHDLEAIVAVPIIEYSPLLSDADLIEIMATSRVDGVLKAVARRPEVSEPVSDAIVATLDIPAVAALLTNPNAQIREATLDRIIDQAGNVEAWHEPLVLRPDLSVRAVRRIAGFVGLALVDILCERNRLDAETGRELKGRVRARIEHDEGPEEDVSDRPGLTNTSVRKAYGEGRLNDAFIEMVASSGQADLVIEALHLLTEFPIPLVKRVMETRSGKAVLSLVWKSGLNMRTALTIQRRVARIPQSSLVLPQDGTNYPLTPEEMTWHLEFFQSTN